MTTPLPQNVIVPDTFWDLPFVAEHERFDLIVDDRGAHLRPCTLTAGDRRDGAGHDDSEWTASSHCGLTKWVCAGCGRSEIVESDYHFPDGWFELAQKDATGDTEAFEGVCSVECVAAWAADSGELRPTRIPGFPAET